VQKETQGDLSRTARLRNNLKVVVCGAEYDAWARTQNPPPDLFLYMDGRLMKGLEAARPELALGPPNDSTKDERTRKVSDACAKAGADAAAAVEKDATEKAAAAKATTETDAARRALAVKDADEKTAAEKPVAEKAAAQQAGNARYIFTYYLDPQFVAKSDTKEPWLRLLERPWDDRPVRVSLGTVAASPSPTVATIGFQRLSVWWLLCWAALFAVAIVAFVKYARRSDIIRDIGPAFPPPSAGAPAPMKAYSLARTQMAVWTFVVAGAMVFIFLVTWNENTLTNPILALIGLSCGTTLLAAAAEGKPEPKETKGFWTDVLTNGDGPSFHRYQMMMFTVIPVWIFIVKTANGLAMPEFDATLLGLMGISSGTYIGFKLKEQ
jgi:hypothetical protein